MTTTWLQLEYIGKGVCLGLLALLALTGRDWQSTGIFLAWALGGLAVSLTAAAREKLREGHAVAGRVFSFLLFLLLENPVRVYAGLLGGMLLGTVLLTAFGWVPWWFAPVALAGGIGLGLVFWFLRRLTNRWLRWGTVLGLAAAATSAILLSLDLETSSRLLFGVQVLLAIPLLYLLTLAGRGEETELEIGAMCVALGVALWMLLPETLRIAGIALPIVVYVLYTRWILPELRVFKHVLRGMSYQDLGQHREALKAYRRALQLNARHQAAREGLWAVHLSMDFGKVAHDPETMALIDLDLCLNRARELLLQSKPTHGRLEEAHKLLNLVLNQQPVMAPAVYYWRAVAHMHAKEFDKAEAELRAVLDNSGYAPDDPYRASVLLACWQLVLRQHPELKRRLGVPALTNEARRMDAIACVEKALKETPEDAEALDLKRLLYDGLTEQDYRSPASPATVLTPGEFDHEYCLQQGLGLIGDSSRWQRGAEYLRIAAHGLPARGPSIYAQIAQACERAGDTEGSRYNREMVKVLAREIGVKNLAAEDKQAYFATVRQLGEAAMAGGDIDKAIENWTLYAESEQAGLDTLRLLTELYERKEDALSALHINEKALFYDGKNKTLLERKDRYYYSVTPAELERRLDAVRNSFDFGYCTRKAKSLLDLRTGGAEQVDWALHLLQLARVVKPDDITAMALCARAHLRRGEETEAVALLEQVRAAKPERFANGEEEDAWFTASRLLGDLYLQSLNRPDQALQCFNDYRHCSKSGADTLFKMGQAFEQMGDAVKAAKCYQNVAVYSDHPLAWDANMALQRLNVPS